MSIKPIVLFTGLFVILSGQSNFVRAAIDDNVEAAESMKSSMRLLLDLDSAKIPLSEFESKSSLPQSPFKSYVLMTQEALDKEMTPELKGAFVLSAALDEYETLKLAKRIQFSPNEVKKQGSWLQIIEKELEKIASSFPSTYYDNYRYGIPD